MLNKKLIVAVVAAVGLFLGIYSFAQSGDSTAPEITLKGDKEVTLEVGKTYTDEGATATDDVDGNITDEIDAISNVDEDVIGTYSITYNVSDAAGNDAEEIVRTVNVVDTTKPVITLVGQANMTVRVNSVYTDAGATAYDNYDKNITDHIISVGTVNGNIVGVYTVTYNVSDSKGNHATEVVRTVNVVDTEAPIITLLGVENVTLEVGSTYTDAGATALDNYDRNITADIVAVSTVDDDVVGIYTVTYNVSDSEGNKAIEVVRTVNVVDTTKPEISLISGSDETEYVEVGTTYTDAGATALDNYDKDITVKIVATGTVNPNVIGTYTITYNVIDAAGNIADTMTRTVIVRDTTKPVITKKVAADIYLQVGSALPKISDLVEALDNYDGNITNNVYILKNPDMNKLGTYLVEFYVKDSSNNEGYTPLRIHVVDTTKPVITKKVAADIYLEVGSALPKISDLVEALDNYDGNITNNVYILNNPDMNKLGTYLVEFYVKDSSNNEGYTPLRVHVVDTTKPVITKKVAADIYLEVGSALPKISDLVEALDNYDGNITNNVYILKNPDMNKLGTYLVEFYVKDSSNNKGYTPLRVHVVDTTKPVITKKVAADIYLEVGSALPKISDLVEALDNYDGNITNNVYILKNPDMNKLGTYLVEFYVKDSSNNEGYTPLRVHVVDTTKPVITIKGDNPLTMNPALIYFDAGATANDNYDGNVTLKIKKTVNVNPRKLGEYTVIYTVKDNSGNEATATRTVVIRDSINPDVIFLPNGDTKYKNSHSAFVTVADNFNVDENSLKYQWTNSTTAPSEESFVQSFHNFRIINCPNDLTGTYYLWILAKDTTGNSIIEKSKAFNLDNTDPTITLNGDLSINIEINTNYTELGATATDAHSGIKGNVKITGTVDKTTVGTYYIYYNVRDNAGNAAVTVTRTINVVDTIKPVISITGEDPQTIEINTPYIELGAIVTDNSGKTIAPVIDISNVDITAVGTYIVTYNANDGYNDADQLTRTINVVDTIKPVITINGENPQTVESKTPYVELGVTIVDNSGKTIVPVIDATAVNTNVIGTYTVTYNANDGYNDADQLTRTVNVVDTRAPAINLYEGSKLVINPTVTIEAKSTLDETFNTYRAYDYYDGDMFTKVIKVFYKFNESTNLWEQIPSITTTVKGKYKITYNVSDNVGNVAAEKTRFVNVVDTQAPAINLYEGSTLVANPTIILEVGAILDETLHSYRAYDYYDGNMFTKVIKKYYKLNDVSNVWDEVLSIDTSILGSYKITYNVSDDSGNAACEKTRFVNVVIANLTFTDGTVNLSSTQLSNNWYTDRYTPYAFATEVFDGSSRLRQSINASDSANNRPSAYSSAFYNTQGRKYDVNDATKVSINLYIPSEWQSTNRRMAGLWGTGFDNSNAVSSYPIIEFASDNDTPRFQVYNTNTGDWINVGLPSGFQYNKWYTMTIELNTSSHIIVYKVGNISYTLNDENNTATIGNVILQGYNTTDGVTYNIYWDNLIVKK